MSSTEYKDRLYYTHERRFEGVVTRELEVDGDEVLATLFLVSKNSLPGTSKTHTVANPWRVGLQSRRA